MGSNIRSSGKDIKKQLESLLLTSDKQKRQLMTLNIATWKVIGLLTDMAIATRYGKKT